jgi:hypothetical protein
MLNFDLKNFTKSEDSQCFFPEAWLSIRHSKTTQKNLFKIQKDNIIKFGKLIYRVRDVVILDEKDSLMTGQKKPKLQSKINNASSSNLVNLINDGDNPFSNDLSNIHNSKNLIFSEKESRISPSKTENKKK